MDVGIDGWMDDKINQLQLRHKVSQVRFRNILLQYAIQNMSILVHTPDVRL